MFNYRSIYKLIWNNSIFIRCCAFWSTKIMVNKTPGHASFFADEKRGGSVSSSSGESVSGAPSRLVPGHRMWANRNGRHILGLIEDYNALRKQISEGRKLSRSMDAQLQECLHTLRLQGSDNKVPTNYHVVDVLSSNKHCQRRSRHCVCIFIGDRTAASEKSVQQREHHAAGVRGSWSTAQTSVESLFASWYHSRGQQQQPAGTSGIHKHTNCIYTIQLSIYKQILICLSSKSG